MRECQGLPTEHVRVSALPLMFGRFKDIMGDLHGISEKVLTDRLRQMADDRLIERVECYGYPPRVEYRVTDHGKHLYVIVYRMTEWGVEHRRLMLG